MSRVEVGRTQVEGHNWSKPVYDKKGGFLSLTQPKKNSRTSSKLSLVSFYSSGIGILTSYNRINFSPRHVYTNLIPKTLL